MRKIIFSFLFLSFVLYAQAGPYFSSTNQLAGLLEQIEDMAAGEPLYSDDGTTANGPNDPWWEIHGFFFKEDGTTGKPGDADRVLLEYRGDEGTAGSNNYYSLRAIDWSDRRYVQKAETVISLVQPADVSRGNARIAEDYELRWTRFINFSGNRFHTVEIGGAGLCDRLEYVDLSNNPTLKYISLEGFTHPDFKADISQNGLSFGKLWDLIDGAEPKLLDNSNNIVSWLDYGNQGLVRRAFPPDRVDLFYDADDFSSPTTYTFTDLDGAALSPTRLGAGVYSFDASLNGKEIYCIAKCDYFPKMPDGLKFLITLTDDMTMLSSMDITPTNPNAFVNEPFTLKASCYDFDGNEAVGISYKWESEGGTFSSTTSATPAFTPTAAGAVEVKCTATQSRAGKPDIVKTETITYDINDARVITSIDVSFSFDIYLTGEDAAFTITIEDQYGKHAGMTNGVTITATQGMVDVENKTFTSFQKGFSVITFAAGDVIETVELMIINNDPLDFVSAEASSFDEMEDDGFGRPVYHGPEFTIDGDRGTRWASDRDRRSEEDNEEFVIVDLGGLHEICMIEIDWEVARPRVWELWFSEDGEDWSNWDNFDTAPSQTYGSHYISRIPVDAKTRFIRIDCITRATSYDFSIWEIVAYEGSLPSSNEIIKKSPTFAYYNGLELIIRGEGKTNTDVYSITGQKILSSTASSINVSSLVKGVYIARVINESGAVSTVKFVK